MSQVDQKAAAAAPQGPGCGTKAAAPRQPLAPTKEDPNNTAAQTLNKFGLCMFQQVASNLSQNVVVCPAGLASSLLTAHTCSTGDTMAELGAMIAAAVGKQEALRDALHALFDTIDRDMAKTDNVLICKLFVNRNLEVNDDCRALVASQMRCDVDRIAFYTSSPTDVAEAVNCAFESCSPLIGQVLSPDTVDPATKLLLASVYYYRGLQADARFERCAEPRAFTATPTAAVELEYACCVGRFLYADVEAPVAAKALELHYQDASLLLLMPERPAMMRELRTHVTQALLAALAAQLKPKTVRVELPLTRIESRCTLNTTLFKAGVKTAFMSDAEFTTLVPAGGARLNDVLHKTALVLDEGLPVPTIPAPTGGPPASKPSCANKPCDAEFALTKPFVLVLRRFSDGRIMLVGVVHELKKLQ